MVGRVDGTTGVSQGGKAQAPIELKLVGEAMFKPQTWSPMSGKDPKVYNVYEAKLPGGKTLRIYVSKDVTLEGNPTVTVKGIKGEKGRFAVVTYAREGKEPKEINIPLSEVGDGSPGSAFVDIDTYGSGKDPNGKANIVFNKEAFTQDQQVEIATGPKPKLQMPEMPRLRSDLFDTSWYAKGPKVDDVDTQAAKPIGDSKSPELIGLEQAGEVKGNNGKTYVKFETPTGRSVLIDKRLMKDLKSIELKDNGDGTVSLKYTMAGSINKTGIWNKIKVDKPLVIEKTPNFDGGSHAGFWRHGKL